MKSVTFSKNLLDIFYVVIAQPVQIHATGCTVRGSNPGGAHGFPNPSTLAPGPTQPPMEGHRVPFPGVKRPRRGVY